MNKFLTQIYFCERPFGLCLWEIGGIYLILLLCAYDIYQFQKLCIYIFIDFFMMSSNLLVESTIYRVSKLFPRKKVEKRQFSHVQVRISQNSDALDKIFGQFRIQRKKLRRKTSSDNVSMKTEIFMDFHSFFESRRKNKLMMVLFSRQIRIQRIKIHKNSLVLTPAQYTIFVGLCYFYFLITYGICKKRKYCNRMSKKKFSAFD